MLAYPTEACYGLGCDPRNTAAVRRLLHIKQRRWQQGLILIASDLRQLERYIDTGRIDMSPVLASWPGPVTWVLPAAITTSRWLTGNHDSIAVRITEHPVAQLLCRIFRGAIVSTSANRSGRAPALSVAQVRRELGARDIDCLLEGRLGGLDKPTRIVDARSGMVLR